eukprot:3949109-Amphidinium_carterae.1
MTRCRVGIYNIMARRWLCVPAISRLTEDGGNCEAGAMLQRFQKHVTSTAPRHSKRSMVVEMQQPCGRGALTPQYIAPPPNRATQIASQ